MVCPWIWEFSFVSDCTFSFLVFLLYSRLTFTHCVQLIIEEMDSDVEAAINPDAMVVEVYDQRSMLDQYRLNYKRRGKHLLKPLKIMVMPRKKLGDGFSLGITFTKKKSLDGNLQELMRLQAILYSLLLLISHQIQIQILLVMSF